MPCLRALSALERVRMSTLSNLALVQQEFPKPTLQIGGDSSTNEFRWFHVALQKRVLKPKP